MVYNMIDYRKGKRLMFGPVRSLETGKVGKSAESEEEEEGEIAK
jgi:hypothetical protein